jgi:hypothetical protein
MSRYERTVTSMMVAGIPVRDHDALDAARLLRDAGFDATAEKLEDAYDAERTVLTLPISDRESIIR